MHKYYLFDFDGTLVDSMSTYVASMLRILDENNVAYESDITKTITPLGVMGTANYFINVLGLEKPIDDLILLMKKWSWILVRNNGGKWRHVDHGY